MSTDIRIRTRCKFHFAETNYVAASRLGGCTEDPAEYQDVIDRLLVKWGGAKNLVPAPLTRAAPQATKIGIIAYGGSDSAVSETLDTLQSDGIHAISLGVVIVPLSENRSL